MMATLPIEFTQMLATRLCHDLAGPISATDNGIELMETDQDASMRAQALDLVKLSAGEAAAKLQMVRLSYGRHDSKSESDVAELRTKIAIYFQYSRIELDWPEGEASGFAPRVNHQTRQLLVNMVLLVASQLVFGGRLSVRKQVDRGLVILGEHTRLRDEQELPDILRGAGDGVYTPQNAPAYFLYYYAQSCGVSLAVQADKTTFKLMVQY